MLKKRKTLPKKREQVTSYNLFHFFFEKKYLLLVKEFLRLNDNNDNKGARDPFWEYLLTFNPPDITYQEKDKILLFNYLDNKLEKTKQDFENKISTQKENIIQLKNALMTNEKQFSTTLRNLFLDKNITNTLIYISAITAIQLIFLALVPGVAPIVSIIIIAMCGIAVGTLSELWCNFASSPYKTTKDRIKTETSEASQTLKSLEENRGPSISQQIRSIEKTKRLIQQMEEIKLEKIAEIKKIKKREEGIRQEIELIISTEKGINNIINEYRRGDYDESTAFIRGNLTPVDKTNESPEDIKPNILVTSDNSIVNVNSAEQPLHALHEKSKVTLPIARI